MENVGAPRRGEKIHGLRISRTSVLLLAAFVTCLVMLWVSTELWTAPQAIVWHATHGNSISVAGHQVPIPWDMWVSESDEDGVTITRSAPTNNNFRSPFGTLLIETTGRQVDFAKDFERLSNINQLPHAGFRYGGLREFGSAQGKGYCWELIGIGSSDISISCRFDGSTIGVDFVGSASYREKIYRIAGAIAGMG
jgi:hypothetical protein